jgi:hypothetical protein
MATYQERIGPSLQAAAASSKEFSIKFWEDIKKDFAAFAEELNQEFNPNTFKSSASENFQLLKEHVLSFVHVPYLPAFHSPGWLTRYLVGPYDSRWLESFAGDLSAGLTVGLTLIPQVRFEIALGFKLTCYAGSLLCFVG